MAKEQKIVISAEILASLKGMDQVVQQLQKGLTEGTSKIDFTKGAGKQVSGLLSKFQSEFKNFNELTKNGLQLGDSKQALKSGEILINTFNELKRIVGDFNTLTLGDAKKLFPQSFDSRVAELQGKLQTLYNNLDKLGTKKLQLTQSEDSIRNLEAEISRLEGEKIDLSTLENQLNLAGQKADEAKIKFENLKQELSNQLTAKIQINTEAIEKSKEEVKTLEVELSELQAKKAQMSSTKGVTKSGNTYSYTSGNVSKTEAEWKKIASATDEATRATKEYKTAQSAIKAINKQKVNDSQIKGINEEIKIKERAIEASKKYQETLTNENKGAQSAKNALDNNNFNTKSGQKDLSAGLDASKIQEVTKAYQDMGQAEQQAAQKATELANAQKTNSGIDTKIQKTNTELDTQRNKYALLKKEIDQLNSNVDTSKLLEAFKNVGIQVDEASLKSKEGIEQLKTQLQNIDQTQLEKIKESLVQTGISADQAEDLIRQFAGGLREIDKSANAMFSLNKEMDMLKNRIGYFFGLTNGVQLFKRAITSALNTVKELDATMTEAAVVTDFSVGDMWDKLPEYASQASDLGAKINDLYGATTLYYQQGLETNAAMALGVETMKMARIAGMESATATEAMTAALRGFNMELNETSATRVNDVYSALAAKTAADTEQIATAMSKTASIAANANMEFETTSALLSQIIETTQEAPETAGTALKTIIARFSEVKKLASEGTNTGEDEEGEVIDVNKIQTALRTVGISMDEFFEGTKGLDDIFLQLAEKWDTLDFKTQRYIATTAAGSRQQSRFIAMMSDYKRTTELVGVANDSAGASQEQFGKTLESMEAKLNQLKDAWDQLLMGLANNEVLKAGIDTLTFILETVNKLLSTLSGGSGIVKTFLTAFMAIKGFSLGRKAIGGIFGGISGLFGGEGKVKKESISLGQRIGTYVGQGIKTAKTRGMSNILLERLGFTPKTMAIAGENLTKSFKLNQLDFSKLDVDAAKTSLLPNITNQMLDLTKAGKISTDQMRDFVNTVKSDGLQAASQKFPQVSSQIKVTGQEAANAGAQMYKMQASMQTVSMASNAAGMGLMMLAGAMEKWGASDEAITVVKGLGIAFMALGMIMPIISSGFTAAGAAGVSSGVATQLAWWWVMLIVAAVALLVAGLVAAGQAAKKASLAGQLEAAQKAAEAAAQAAEAAKEAYDELLSARDEYNELQSQLDGLTKGTNEWKQALIDANSQVLSLLSTYPELAQYIKKGEHGQLEIMEEGFDKVIEDQYKGLQNAQGALISAQINEKKIERKITEQDLQKNFKSKDSYYDSNADTWTNVGTGDEIIRESVYDIGFVAETSTIEALREALTNDAVGLLKPSSEDGVDDITTTNIDERYSQALNDIAAQSDYTAEELYNLISVLQEYDNALAANEAEIQAQAEALLTTKQSQETADYKYGENVVSGFARQMTTEDYDERISARADEIYQKDGVAEKDKEGRFAELAEEYNVTSKLTGDDLEDLKILYAEMKGIDISEIPENIAKDKDAMAKEIAEMDMSNEIAKKMENFRTNMMGLSSVAQEEVAALISGDASELSVSELSKMQDQDKSALNYAGQMYIGKKNDAGDIIETEEQAKSQMLSDLGYEDKTVADLSEQDQNAWFEQNGPTEQERSQYLKRNADGDYIDAQGNVVDDAAKAAFDEEAWRQSKMSTTVTAEVQFEIDEQQTKEYWAQMEADAKASIEKYTGQTQDFSEGSALGSMSPEALKNLGKQISTMSQEDAQNYVANFEKVISTSGLGQEASEELSNYLSTVDWSNMTQATQAMEYMQNLGIDTSTIEAYWNAATDGANTFVSSIAEALSLVERLQGNIRGVSEISERLSEGKGTYEDVQKMISAGADVSDFQLTADGWKATGDALTKATDQMKEYNAEQARAVADQHQEALDKAQNNTKDGITINKDGSFSVNSNNVLGSITSVNDEGKLEGGKVTGNNAKEIGEIIGATAFDSENETYDQYVERIQTAYNEYINLLNNGEDIAIINEKAAAYAEASTMSADENQAKGGTQESVIYSAQNEAKEAGLDVSELMAYADTLTNIDSGATRVQIALANMKMNAGLGEVIDSYDEWSKVIDKDTGALKDTSSTGVATYNKLKASVNKMLNTSKDLSDSFWENADNMKNIEKAAKGDEEALGELQKAAAADYIVQLAAETDNETVKNSLNQLSDLINDFEMPTLKPGDTLDDQTFIDKCNNLIKASGMTATQVSEAFKQMGFDVEIETATGWYKRPVTTTYTTTSGNFPYNYTTTEHTETDYVNEYGEYPVVKTLTSTGTGGGGVSEQNKSGGGGGGGGSKKKSQHWENPYDKLYNVTEEIEELQRDRNALEEEFSDLMEDGYLNAEKVSEAINKQAENLSRELALQRKVTAERKKQLASIQQEKYTYTKKDGKEEEEVTTTYKNAWSALGLDETLGMSFEQLFKYDEERGVKILDVDALQKIVDNEKLGEDQGALIESLIGKAEEWIQSIEESEEAARELERQLKELEDIGKEDAIDMENRVAEAIQNMRQKEIDNMQSLSDTLSEANSSILDSLQESIDLERQIRDNTKQEEDIADMEARLAYLRRDTSGANQQEILQLEEQLGDARESYSDNLVDQQLQKLSDENAKAENQRQQQIDLAQSQLDYQVESGEILKEAANMLKTMSPKQITDFLKGAEGFDSLSEIQQMKWMNDTNDLLEGWKIGMKNWELEEVKDKEGTIEAKDEDGNALKLRYDQESGKWIDDATGNTYAAAAWDEEKGTYVAYGKTEAETETPGTPQTPVGDTPSESYPYGKPSEATKTVKKGQKGKPVKAVQYALNKLGYGNSGTQSVDGNFGSKTEKAVKAFQGAMNISKDGKVGPKTREKFKAKQFKTGGLADFTGPAWLDGTKSKPEIILNQQDSKNFIMLKDVLAEILQGATSTKSGQKSGGDNYFDISIIVDEISSDYDVDQMAARIKQQIYDDSTYRNVNAINLIR